MPHSEELQIQAGDVVLASTLLLPEAPPPADRNGRYPNALMLPSWLPRDRDGNWDGAGHPGWYEAEPARTGLLARLAEALALRGVASLRADPRGCGGSGGSWEASSLFTRIDDARDQLAAMRGHPALDLRRTGIVGHGEGAGIGLAIAIGDPAISALTLVGASARSWRDVLRRGAAMRGRDGTDHQHPIVAAIDRWSEELLERAERKEAAISLPMPGGNSARLSLAGAEQAIHTPSLALATMLQRSVTLVHGSRDAWSDAHEMELLAAALAGAGAHPRSVLVPAAGHDLMEAGDDLIGELADDLAARLLPRDLPPVLLAIEQMG